MSDQNNGGGPQAAPARGEGKAAGRLRWALAASVALNLLLTGLIVGAAARDARWSDARWWGARSDHGPRAAPGAAWSGREDGERSLRAQVRAALEQRAPAFEARREDLRAAWSAVRDAAQAEPLDPGLLDAALAALRDAEAALAAERHAAFAALAVGMGPDQRARMLRAMGNRFERRHGRDQ